MTTTRRKNSKSTLKTRPDYGLTRVTQEGEAPGWNIRITSKGKTYRKFFSDAMNGGDAGAHSAAKRWRNHLIKKLPADVKKRSARAKRSRHEHPDYPGITRVDYPSRNKVYRYWSFAFQDTNGRRRRRSFSIDKLGEEQAAKSAYEALQEHQASQAKSLTQRDT